MERTLANFVRALRASDVRISTAETLDAFRTAEIVGWRDREALKEALAVTLPKTRDEKHAFDACFDTFFRFEEFQDGAVLLLDVLKEAFGLLAHVVGELAVEGGEAFTVGHDLF